MSAPLDPALTKPTQPIESIAVVQAQRSFAEGIITAAEFEQVVQRDNDFRVEEAKDAEGTLLDRSKATTPQSAETSVKGSAEAAANLKANVKNTVHTARRFRAEGTSGQRSSSVGSSIASLPTPGPTRLANEDADCDEHASGNDSTIGHRSIDPIMNNEIDIDTCESPAHNARITITATPTSGGINSESKKSSSATWNRSRTRSGSVGRSTWSLSGRVSSTSAASRSPSNLVSGYWKDRVTASVLQVVSYKDVCYVTC